MNPVATWIALLALWAFLWVRLPPGDTGRALLYASIGFLGWLVARAGMSSSTPSQLDEPFSVPKATSQFGELDALRYARHYPDTRQLTEEQARLHYAETGVREGRTAFLVGVAEGGTWNDEGYRTLHPEAERSGMTAKEHYRTVGWKERRRIALWIAPAAAPALTSPSPPAAPSQADEAAATLYHATIHPPHLELWQRDGGGSFRAGTGGFVSCDPRPFRAAGATYTLELWLRRGDTAGTLCRLATSTDRARPAWEMRATAAGVAMIGAEVDIPGDPQEWLHVVLVRKADGSGEVYRQGTRLASVRGLPSGAEIQGWTLLGPEDLAPKAADDGASRVAPAIARVLLHRGALGPVDILEAFLSTARRFGTMGDPDRKPPRAALLMELDAGVAASYPGKGPIWYDLQWMDENDIGGTVGGRGGAGQAGDVGGTGTPASASTTESVYGRLARIVVDKVLAWARDPSA